MPPAKRLPEVLSAAAIAAALVGYLIANRNSWFFADDWVYLLTRSVTDDPVDALFAPHNEHWSTLPVLAVRATQALVGMRSFWPYIVQPLLLHVGICCVLWALLRRNGAHPWLTFGAVTIAALNGAGAENLTWATQTGFLGATLFPLLAMLLADADALSRRRQCAIAATLLGALMCSGISLPVVAGALVFIVLRHGRAVALRLAAVPCVAYVAWFAALGRTGLDGPVTDASLGDRLLGVRYFWTGFTHVWEANTAIPASGFVLAAVVVAPVLASRGADPLGRIAVAGVTAWVSLYLVTALGRSALGTEQALSSRYVYIATIVSLPAVVWCAGRAYEWLRARGPVGVPVVAAALAFALVTANLASEARRRVQIVQNVTQPARTRILAAVELLRRDEPVLIEAPQLDTIAGITVSQLRIQLEDFPDSAVSPRHLLDARAALQVAVSTALFPALEALPELACTAVVSKASSVEVKIGPRGGRFRVSAPGTKLTTTLVLDGAAASQTHEWQSDQATWVGVSTRSATLQITTEVPGAVAVCV